MSQYPPKKIMEQKGTYRLRKGIVILMKYKNYLTSAELAARFHTTIDAVRYYEKLGLLHPTRNPSNNYRQFSSDDVRVMSVIQELTRLHIPLSVICKLEQNRTVPSTLSLLHLEEDYIKKEIRDLKKIEKTIHSRISFIEKYYHNTPLNEFSIQHFPARKCLKIIDGDIPIEDFDLHVSNLVSSLGISVPVMGVSDCYTLNIEQFRRTHRFDFDNIFYYADIPEYKSNYTLPEGDYLVYTYHRTDDKDPTLFLNVLDYANSNHLPIGKEAYFFFVIDEDESADQREHIIQAQIPLTEEGKNFLKNS